jgi:hypothetical protein
MLKQRIQINRLYNRLSHWFHHRFILYGSILGIRHVDFMSCSGLQNFKPDLFAFPNDLKTIILAWLPFQLTRAPKKNKKNNSICFVVLIQVEFSAIALDAAGQFKVYHRYMTFY